MTLLELYEKIGDMPTNKGRPSSAIVNVGVDFGNEVRNKRYGRQR